MKNGWPVWVAAMTSPATIPFPEAIGGSKTIVWDRMLAEADTLKTHQIWPKYPASSSRPARIAWLKRTYGIKVIRATLLMPE